MKNFQKIMLVLALTITIGSILVLPVFAGKESTTLLNPLGDTDSVSELIATIIRAILSFLGALATLMFIYGGFQMILSGGSPDKVKKGQNTLVWAAIGIVVVLSSYGILQYIFTTLAPTA